MQAGDPAPLLSGAAEAVSRPNVKRNVERYAVIMAEVARTGYTSIEALAALCGTSTQTVRRDLVVLARGGRIERYHGGASLVSQSGGNFEKRSGANVAQKLSAVAPLADIIPDGASVFLAGGSTLTLATGPLLVKQKLVVVTNNLHAGVKLYDREGFEIMVVGGWIRTASGSLTGESAAACIDNFSLDFCLISTSCVSPDGTLLEMDPAVADPVVRMLKNARCRVLIVDTSKFHARGIVRTGHLSEMDHVLTDGPVPPDLAQLMVRHGVTHHIGPPPHRGIL